MLTPRILFFTLAAALGAALAAEPAAPATGTLSPSDALARADARLGSAGVHFPERPGAGQADRTLAPYFEVRGDGDVERLPLEETRADVQVAGVIARVRVTQTFHNGGRRPIEAVYVFPASTRAAVHGMRVRVGERTIEARIERKAEARAQYQQARQEGRRAALLEQERPNVFTMSVANVMPGDRLVAELDYSELIVPDGGVYELVYPTVVGPRYGGGADPAADGWIANPHLPAGSAAPYRFGFQAHVESAIGLKEVSSPSHRLDITWRDPMSADVKLAGSPAGDKDVVLRWRLAGDRIEAGALLYRGPGADGYFLAMVEPPAQVAAGLIPPREYVFVVDVSGSMHGFPLETSKALLRSLLPRLRPQDSFNVVFFSGTSWILSPRGSLAPTAENLRRALAAIDGQRGGGGTELMQALQVAYGLPRADERVARAVVVVTDGYVAVEAQAFKFVREHLNEASCFAFGIGSSVNRGLIEALARAGQGEPFVVLGPDRAAAQAERLVALVERPVLSRISYRFEGFEARAVAPVRLPDLLAERPLVLFGKWRGEPRGRIVFTGQGAGGPFETAIDLGKARPQERNQPLRALWARKWVELLDDERQLAPAQEIDDAITDLGLSHQLLTAFTSFVAVDSEVVNRAGQAAQVKQPLPLPEGVSELAVGGAAYRGAVAKQALHAPVASLAPAEGVVAYAPSAAPPPAPARAQDRAGAGRADLVRARPSRKESAPAATATEQLSGGSNERRLEPKSGDATTTPMVTIVAEQVEGLVDSTSLREAVRKALLRAAGGCLAAGEYRIKLVIDAGGRVGRVVLLAAPDAAARRCLERALLGLSSGATPAEKVAEWTATVRVVR